MMDVLLAGGSTHARHALPPLLVRALLDKCGIKWIRLGCAFGHIERPIAYD